MDSTKDVAYDDVSYEKICEQFLNEIEKQKKSFTKWASKADVKRNLTEYHSSDNKWIVQVEENPYSKKKIQTWIYTAPQDQLEKQKEQGLVGTDGRTIIKFIDHDDYDFVRTQDFIDRSMLACDAVEQIFKKANKKMPVQNGKTWIQIIREQFAEKISRECDLADYQKSLINDEDEHARNSIFLEKRKKAKQMIGEQIVFLAEELRTYGDQLGINQASLTEIVSLIEEEEKQLTLKRGRPNYIKVGKLQDDQYDNDGNEIENPIISSCQFVQGKKTYPSNLRDRNKKSESFLSNFVIDVTARITKVGGQYVVKSLLEIIGHSSYPPIAVKDEIERRHYTYLAVEENIKNIAKRKLKRLANKKIKNVDGNDEDEDEDDDAVKEEGKKIQDHGEDDSQDTSSDYENGLSLLSQKDRPGSKNNPLKISLNTMTLLTPFRNKQFDRLLRNKESEVDQLAETVMALDAIRYREGNKPLCVKIDGEDVYLDVTTSCMNIPVNISKKKHKAISEPCPQQIKTNARGFYEYYEKIYSFLADQNNLPKDDNASIKGIANIAEVLDLINHDKEVKDINALIKEKEESLAKRHASCLKLQAEYVDFLEKERQPELLEGKKKEYQAERERLYDIYKAERAAILNIEEILHKQYENIHTIRKKRFNENKNTVDACHSMITKALENKKLDEGTRRYLTMTQRFLRAQDMYYNKKYADKAYHFQALYVLSIILIDVDPNDPKAMRQAIEAFCKSSEDRTGWLRITLLRYLEFYERYNRDPDIYDQGDMAKYNAALFNAKQLSASIENNGANAPGARGTQVSKQQTGLSENFISKKMGTMAKKPIKYAKKLAASKDSPFDAKKGLLGLAVAISLGGLFILVTHLFGLATLLGIVITDVTVGLATGGAWGGFSLAAFGATGFATKKSSAKDIKMGSGVGERKKLENLDLVVGGGSTGLVHQKGKMPLSVTTSSVAATSSAVSARGSSPDGSDKDEKYLSSEVDVDGQGSETKPLLSSSPQ